jgi:hypothetical protein
MYTINLLSCSRVLAFDVSEQIAQGEDPVRLLQWAADRVQANYGELVREDPMETLAHYSGGRWENGHYHPGAASLGDYP